MNSQFIRHRCYLKVFHLFHVRRIRLPWNWSLWYFNNQEAVTLYLTYSSNTMMGLATPGIPGFCNRSLYTYTVANLKTHALVQEISQ